MTTDPIGDFIIRLKNAGLAGKESVDIPFSRLKGDIALILKREGYIVSFVKHGKKVGKTLEVKLAYDDSGARIHGVRRVSKPSRRVYAPARSLHPVKQGFGTSVLSTPQGILSGREARKQNVGGEVLFEIW